MAARGEFALLTQCLEAALSKAGQPVPRGTMAHDHHVLMLLTDAAAQKRDADSIGRYAPRLAALAQRDGHQLYLAVAWRAQAVAARLGGDPAHASALLAQALAVFTALGAQWQAGRTHFEMAETARASGEAADAQAHYEQAAAAFEALGAAPDAARAKALAAAD